MTDRRDRIFGWSTVRLVAKAPPGISNGDISISRLGRRIGTAALPAGLALIWLRLIHIDSVGTLELTYLDDHSNVIGQIRLPRPNRFGLILSIVDIPVDTKSIRLKKNRRTSGKLDDDARAGDVPEEMTVCRLGGLPLSILLAIRYAVLVVLRPASMSAELGRLISILTRHGYGDTVMCLVTEGNVRLGYDKWIQRFEPDSSFFEPPAQSRDDRPNAKLSVLLAPEPEDFDHVLATLRSLSVDKGAAVEILLASDKLPMPGETPLGSFLAEASGRVELVVCQQDEPFAARLNRICGLARGDYLFIVASRAILHRNACGAAAATLLAQPHLKLLYCDEDQIGNDGKRHSPAFKPEWNPDLYRYNNYIGECIIIERNIFENLGGLDGVFGGAAIDDLILRAGEILKTREIGRIPYVLVHIPSAAANAPLTTEDRRRDMRRSALRAHLDRLSLRDAVIEDFAAGQSRICYPIPDKPPLVSLVVLTRDRVELLRDCIDSIFAYNSYENFEILIVDNDSREPRTFEYFEEIGNRGNVEIIQCPGKFNYAKLINYAVEAARGSVIATINNDIYFRSDGWLEEMLGHALRPDVGCVGARLLYADATVQHGGVILWIRGLTEHFHYGIEKDCGGYLGRAKATQDLSAVTGAVMVFRREIFDQVGGFDERLAVDFNDIDFCLKIRAHGNLVVYTAHPEIYHHGSASRGKARTIARHLRIIREGRRFRKHWRSQIAEDPYFSPNLALDREVPVFACPPRVDRLCRPPKK